MKRILIADDDKNLRKVLSSELSAEGYEVTEADTGGKTVGMLEGDSCDLLLLDLNMPGLDGIEVLKQMRTMDKPVEVIVMTGCATVSTAVEAMKLGACDYLTKPFRLDELRVVIDKALEKRRLRGENLSLKVQIRRQSGKKEIISQSPLMFGVIRAAKRVAATEFPVLICGESGVGKELLAWTIHESSQRAEGPFIPINCGAIPETMLETELFGHEKGAFTGAASRKPGLLEIADGGTLFFDEIGELTPQLQVKLLRVIETKSFFRVGGTREVFVNVKLLFATNKDLKAECGRGSFRADLYYRICALTLLIPPLRERREDIPLLIAAIIASNPAFRAKSFRPEAIETLTLYSWPGNVRELQNVVHRTLLLSGEDEIGPEELPSDLMPAQTGAGKRIDDVERAHVFAVLREVGGHRGKAARILGIDPKTLYRKLRGYGVRQ